MAAQPTRIGEFVIESKLGEGGMGIVFRARQVALDRWVAVKVLPSAKENQSFIDRFYREAKSAARLVHPNIIQIHTVGDWEGIPYFSMEYVEGEDIEHLLRPGNDPFSVDEVIEIIRSVVKALALATEHGIVHRDIKPANVMVTKSGLVKVMDFGLAKGMTQAEQGLTQQGLIVGTPAYMSPEQGSSGTVDARSDQYSLGCVFYECICSRPPFKADNVASLIFKHMYENPDPISAHRPGVNPDLENICMRMLAKNPVERFPTPEELLEALAMIPSNSNLAELTLSKRVSRLLQSRKQKASEAGDKTMVTPGAMGVPPASASPSVEKTFVAPQEAQVKPLAPAAALSIETPAPAAMPVAASANEPGPRSVPPPPRPGLAPAPQQPAAALAVEVTPLPIAPPPQIPLPPVPGVTGRTPLPGTSPRVAPPPAVSGRTPIPGSSTRVTAARIHEAFYKLNDGRWAYKPDLGRCPFAEGLALAVPGPANQRSEGLGDCLLCSNWNKRTGCAVAYCQELEGRFHGMRLLAEQAIVWTGAGRLDKAIAMLDNYVRANPDDPEGYRELARIYERPEYRGRDKRRAIVLYSRFVELARKTGGFSNVEVTRAEERVNALRGTPAALEGKGSGMHATVGIPFQSFYRGGVVCFCYSVLTGERLIAARAGEVDPDSAITSSDIGGAMSKATSIFRRFKSEQAKKDEQAEVKRELTRFSELSMEALQKDPARILSIGLEQVTDVEMSHDTAVNIRCLTVRTQQQSHQLLFTESNIFRADQCYALIKRRLGK